MKRSDFIFDSVHLMYYKFHKSNFKSSGSYIDSPDWRKKEKNNNKSFLHYATTVALNYEEVKWNPERVSNIKPFINRYNWKEINYLSKIGDCKTLEKNNPTIALNTLYIKEKEILPAYISEHNSTREKQIILLMIRNKKRRTALSCSKKNLSTLLKGVTSKHHCVFHCLNCLHSFRKKKLNVMKKYAKIKVFVELQCHQEKDKIL